MRAYPISIQRDTHHVIHVPSLKVLDVTGVLKKIQILQYQVPK